MWTSLFPVLVTLVTINAAAVVKREDGDPLFPDFEPASVACIAETPGSRALVGAELVAPDMTHQKCKDFCSDYNLAYLTYGNECRCGNALLNGASLNRPSNNCNMKCGGSARENCGGSWAFTLYVRPNWLPQLSPDLTPKAQDLPDGWSVASSTCVAEGTRGRALNKGYFSDPFMSPARCVEFAEEKGAMYAGLQNGNECWVGDFLDNGASLERTATNCNQNCAGDLEAKCGGPWSLSLWVNPRFYQAPPPPPVKPADPTYPTVTRAGWTATPNQCIVDVKNRALTGHQWIDENMTVDKCLERCTSLGYEFAGVEYTSECYCGSFLANGATLDRVATQCNMKCGGEPLALCGGPDSLQMYRNPSLAIGQQPVAALPARWSAASTPCIREVAGRALTGAFTSTADMTVNKCINYCDARGYDFAGLEYGIGGECFCGSTLVNGASLNAPSNQCNMACRGDARSFCGGPDAIQLYVYA